MFAAALILAAFLFLWIASALWWRRRPVSQTQMGAAMAVYSVLVLFAGWWWSVPLDHEKRLTNLTTSQMTATSSFNCADIDEVLERINKLGRKELTIRKDGSLLLTRELWINLSPSQKELFASLGKQVAGCSGSAVPDRIEFLDRDTGLPLHSAQSGNGA